MSVDNSKNMRLQLICDRIDQNLSSMEYYVKDEKDISRGSLEIFKIHLDDIESCLNDFRIISGINKIEKKGE